MRNFFTSKKFLIIFTIVFAIAVVIFNYYDIVCSDDTHRAYNHSEINSMKLEMVNINTADVNTLCDLPYVSESQAQSIIDYRQKHGKFESIEELKEVKGIGEKTFDKIKTMIEV